MTRSSKRNKIEIRFVVSEGTEDFEFLKKIQKLTQIDDYKAILKSCIKIAYNQYYQKMDKTV
jgi:hypothetical protein